jgi:hypothetical protein
MTAVQWGEEVQTLRFLRSLTRCQFSKSSCCNALKVLVSIGGFVNTVQLVRDIFAGIVSTAVAKSSCDLPAKSFISATVWRICCFSCHGDVAGWEKSRSISSHWSLLKLISWRVLLPKSEQWTKLTWSAYSDPNARAVITWVSSERYKVRQFITNQSIKIWSYLLLIQYFKLSRNRFRRIQSQVYPV